MKAFFKAPISNAIGILLVIALVLSGSLAVPAELAPLALGGGTTNFTSISVSGTTSLGTGEIDATEIADAARAINFPLLTFIECTTNAGTLIGFDTTADALPDYVNSSTDGTGFVLRYDDTGSTEDTAFICNNFLVPPDYASGGHFRIRALKDAHTAAAEVVNCGVSVNGAALQAVGIVTTTVAASTAYTCTPTIAALVVNDSVSFHLNVTSDSTINDQVDIAAVEFVYTATQ